MDYQPYLYSKRALLIINPVAGRKAVNTQIAPIIRIFMEAGYRESQKREKELQTVKGNIETILRQQEPEHEESRMKNEQEL